MTWICVCFVWSAAVCRVYGYVVCMDMSCVWMTCVSCLMTPCVYDVVYGYVVCMDDMCILFDERIYVCMVRSFFLSLTSAWCMDVCRNVDSLLFRQFFALPICPICRKVMPNFFVDHVHAH